MTRPLGWTPDVHRLSAGWSTPGFLLDDWWWDWLVLGRRGKQHKETEVWGTAQQDRLWTHPMDCWAPWNTPRGEAPTDDLRRDRLKDGDEHSVEQEETKLQGKTNKGSQWGTAQALCDPVATNPKAYVPLLLQQIERSKDFCLNTARTCNWTL